MLQWIKFHKKIYESGRWFEYSTIKQLGNIWSEVNRMILAKEHWNQSKYIESAYRMYELFDMSIDDPKHKGSRRLREICRARELVSDYFFWNNIYNSSKWSLMKYFNEFWVLANIRK